MMSLIVILVLILLVVFFFIGQYNGLVTARNAFKNAFAQHHKAKISLDVTIEEEGLVAVEFRGLFVALR